MNALVDAPVNIKHNKSEYKNNFNQDKISTLFKGTKMIPKRAGSRQLTTHATKLLKGGKSTNENRSLLSGT